MTRVAYFRPQNYNQQGLVRRDLDGPAQITIEGSWGLKMRCEKSNFTIQDGIMCMISMSGSLLLSALWLSVTALASLGVIKTSLRSIARLPVSYIRQKWPSRNSCDFESQCCCFCLQVVSETILNLVHVLICFVGPPAGFMRPVS